ncbi:TetR/AcrR family transcriptional regulator [Actinomycetospora straminea]|uniref:TetR/AcrR family transcriptional regulator n=1 Tax=Actinomycetospora straminea TaxID=663607 RepID=UPI0023673B0F|nr:TetR/AcrR family transcriptional regulator [Actinomycetospora straminea]MDD7931012.1 TetR/AcrR family transcriptional regulator [Actinomycetospora straminea]
MTEVPGRGRPSPPAHAPRAEQVRETRRRVLDAARDLFVRRGYAGATVDAIAHRAGVSTQTVYNVVGGKAEVLKAVYDVALAGDDIPVAMTQRPHAVAMRSAPDAATALAIYAQVGRLMLERAGPLLVTVYLDAPQLDPQVRAFVETIEAERRTGTGVVAGWLAERFGLREGVTVAEARDVLWTLLAPETAHRLVDLCGWSPARWEAWIARTATEALCGS